MGYRCVVALAFGLAVSGLSLSEAAMAADKGSLVPCYDPERELVQKVAPANCAGEILSRSEAEKIRARIKQQRFDRARTPEQDPRRPGAEKSGSGVLVTDAGHIVTAAHVVAGCRRTRLHHPSGPTREARVVARHPRTDLALLHTDSIDRAPIAIAHGNGGDPGAPMATIGYPNLGKTVIRPIRTGARFAGRQAIGRTGSSGEPKMVFQGELRPGNSGGALVDQDERLVGIVIAQIDTPSVYAATGKVIQHVGFAEPISAVRDLLNAAKASPPAQPMEVPQARAERFVFRVTCRPENDRK